MTAVDLSCRNCGEANAPEARFCSSCGARLESSRALREERRLVSVLFVDLVGFTTRSDGADPEDVRDALQLYHAHAKERIEHYGGTLEKFIGDAVMAVFGAPVAHGDDAERAVRAGLHVLEGIGELNQAHGLGLAARAAVNTGDAVVSMVSERGEALAMGDVVNTASRLQSAAPAGRVVVGRETYRASRHAIRYESSPAIDAKGKAEPVEAWLAVEPSTAPAEGRVASRPIVGRDRELELMASVWTRALSDRRPHLVTLMGPPGIGKTRLCREVTSIVAAEGGRVLRGRCLPYGGQAGYQAFSFLVRDACGILASDPHAVAREKLERTVYEVVPEPEAPETARFLALLLGLAADDEVAAGRDAGRLLFYAARRFLESSGLAEPTLVVFEDLHWAQASEVELLEYLAKHLRDSPLVLVVIARPELLDAHPTWGSGLAAQTTIPLDPLTAADASVLAGRIVEEATERSFNLARLVEVAGGNPLFLEELAASLVELGDSEDLPITVRAAIAARIDAMPSDARTALMSAAVVGKTFWRGALQSAGGIEDVDEALNVLESRDLVRRDPSSQLAGDAQFTFRHILIREVAYATVPRAMRRERHAAVARYIEETLVGSAEAASSILAYHWSAGGEPARAIPYLLAAANAARRGWAKGAAIDLYSKALELAGDGDLRRRIRLQQGLALVELQDHERAYEVIVRLLPELEGEEKLEALLFLGHATIWTERDSEALATAAEALGLARKLGDDAAIAAALALESEGLAQRGAEGDLQRALELGDRALETWPPGARPFDLTNFLHLHANTTCWAGHFDRSVELSRRTRAMATDVQSAESLLRGGGLEALALAGLGRHEEAIAIWDELFEVGRELGANPRVVLNYSALAYRELHDLDEARSRSEQAMELSAGMTFGMPMQFARSDLLFTQLLAGDVGGAQAAWPSLWEGAAHATGWTTWLIAGRLATARAEIALRAETPESAVEWARRAIEIAQRTRRRKYEARSLTIFGEALGKLGRRDEALAAVRAAVALTDELIGQPGRWRAREALGRMSHLLGEDAAAAGAYAEAGDLIHSFAGTLAPPRAARFLAAPEISQILSLAGRRPAA
jgi:class 3 adenylate cyclase/tetratricopeptide (TPR) repeat protein